MLVCDALVLFGLSLLLVCVCVCVICVLCCSALSPAASTSEGLPPRVLLTITKLQCMLESKQERIAALERQVEDLMQDRKFLRSQIENLTSNRSMAAFAQPTPMVEGQCTLVTAEMEGEMRFMYTALSHHKGRVCYVPLLE